MEIINFSVLNSIFRPTSSDNLKCFIKRLSFFSTCNRALLIMSEPDLSKPSDSLGVKHSPEDQKSRRRKRSEPQDSSASNITTSTEYHLDGAGMHSDSFSHNSTAYVTFTDATSSLKEVQSFSSLISTRVVGSTAQLGVRASQRPSRLVAFVAARGSPTSHYAGA